MIRDVSHAHQDGAGKSPESPFVGLTDVEDGAFPSTDPRLPILGRYLFDVCHVTPILARRSRPLGR